MVFAARTSSESVMDQAPAEELSCNAIKDILQWYNNIITEAYQSGFVQIGASVDASESSDAASPALFSLAYDIGAALEEFEELREGSITIDGSSNDLEALSHEVQGYTYENPMGCAGFLKSLVHHALTMRCAVTIQTLAEQNPSSTYGALLSECAQSLGFEIEQPQRIAPDDMEDCAYELVETILNESGEVSALLSKAKEVQDKLRSFSETKLRAYQDAVDQQKELDDKLTMLLQKTAEAQQESRINVLVVRFQKALLTDHQGTSFLQSLLPRVTSSPAQSIRLSRNISQSLHEMSSQRILDAMTSVIQEALGERTIHENKCAELREVVSRIVRDKKNDVRACAQTLAQVLVQQLATIDVADLQAGFVHQLEQAAKSWQQNKVRTCEREAKRAKIAGLLTGAGFSKSRADNFASTLLRQKPDGDDSYRAEPQQAPIDWSQHTQLEKDLVELADHYGIMYGMPFAPIIFAFVRCYKDQLDQVIVRFNNLTKTISVLGADPLEVVRWPNSVDGTLYKGTLLESCHELVASLLEEYSDFNIATVTSFVRVLRKEIDKNSTLRHIEDTFQKIFFPKMSEEVTDVQLSKIDQFIQRLPQQWKNAGWESFVLGWEGKLYPLEMIDIAATNTQNRKDRRSQLKAVYTCITRHLAMLFYMSQGQFRDTQFDASDFEQKFKNFELPQPREQVAELTRVVPVGNDFFQLLLESSSNDQSVSLVTEAEVQPSTLSRFPTVLASTEQNIDFSQFGAPLDVNAATNAGYLAPFGAPVPTLPVSHVKQQDGQVNSIKADSDVLLDSKVTETPHTSTVDDGNSNTDRKSAVQAWQLAKVSNAPVMLGDDEKYRKAYAILGLSHDQPITITDLNKAFYRRALATHPDRDASRLVPADSDAFKKLSKARQRLLKAEKKNLKNQHSQLSITNHSADVAGIKTDALREQIIDNNREKIDIFAISKALFAEVLAHNGIEATADDFNHSSVFDIASHICKNHNLDQDSFADAVFDLVNKEIFRGIKVSSYVLKEHPDFTRIRPENVSNTSSRSGSISTSPKAANYVGYGLAGVGVAVLAYSAYLAIKYGSQESFQELFEAESIKHTTYTLFGSVSSEAVAWVCNVGVAIWKFVSNLWQAASSSEMYAGAAGAAATGASGVWYGSRGETVCIGNIPTKETLQQIKTVTEINPNWPALPPQSQLTE